MIKRVIAFLSLEDMALVPAAYTWVCTSPPSLALARSSSDNKLILTSSLSADDPACARGNIRTLSKEEDTAFLGKVVTGTCQSDQRVRTSVSEGGWASEVCVSVWLTRAVDLGDELDPKPLDKDWSNRDV
jgi:hypothetical protein